MEVAVDKIKGFAKSSQDFIDDLLRRRDNSIRRSPIEILKRLQREAFSDLMKLRDRQDKVERVLSFYKPSKASPFEETGTLVTGEIGALGAILMTGDVDQQHYDVFHRAGIDSGISSRLTFQTSIGQKDTLLADFAASEKGTGYSGDIPGGALFLHKALYVANISDWFSAIAIPVGAQFRDLRIATNLPGQRKGLTDLSFVGPPLLSQHNGAAVGVTVSKSSITASVAQSLSSPGMQSCYDGIGHCFSTFGQIVCQLPRGIKCSILGTHKVTKLSTDRIDFGTLVIPVSFLRHRTPPDSVVEASVPPTGIGHGVISNGSFALQLESELDEHTRIGGWIEMKNVNSKHLQWAINAFDDSQDELGWGISIGGTVGNASTGGRLQAESYIKVNMGKKFSLKPGVAYAVDRNARIVALMLRSNWSF